MKRAALYIRVSTLEQAQEGYSIGAQKERLLAFCKAHDWAVAECYVDGGYSGSNLDRPGIQKLAAEVASFDLVLVMKLDRLSRSQRDTLHLIEDVFLPNGVDFVSMSDRIDKLHRDKVGLEEHLAAIEPPPKRDFDDDSFDALLADCATVWEAAGPEEKRQVITSLIRRITLDGEHVDIEWAFL